MRRVRALIADDPRRVRLQRARIAAEVADGALDPVDPLAFASTVPLALSCYREAAYWALLAQDTALEAPDLQTAIERSAPEIVSFAAGGEKGIASLRRDFVDKTFVELASLREQELGDVARAAKTFVHALLARKTDAERRLVALRDERRRRVTIAGLLAFAIVAAGSVGYLRVRTAPDLALGKPWRTSSTLAQCKPEVERCAGARTKMFFSTVEEESPWFELDLGRPHSVAVVEVDNRTDCCIDRARGLTVELSMDAKTWVAVARQPGSFHSWQAHFPSRQARYVRLMVPRKTVLHLERVAVRER
jgi:hypothetical protein